MGRFKKISIQFFSLVAIYLLASCSSTSVDLTKERDPKKLYDYGVKSLKDEDYLEAQDVFAEIKKRFSQSAYFALAELRAADLEFDQGNYAESALLYENFVELYPTHSEAAYAQFRRAKSYMEDCPELEARDQSAASLAAASATQLLTRYPSSPFAAEAKEIFYRARFQLAKKEAYIARFYRKKGFDQASNRRWKRIPTQFQDLKGYKPAQEFWKEVQSAISGISKES
ncbi:MAG: outer membrane protein assembly factor BamD [Bdellovibrionota bacterium]